MELIFKVVHVSFSLQRLLSQVNEIAPNRLKTSDGAIGDEAHRARKSDHNPDARGIVCARDFTDDPGGGCGGEWLATSLVRQPDRRVAYIIWNRQIWSLQRGWRPYTGSNPHRTHVHISVNHDEEAEDPRPWRLGLLPSGPVRARDNLRRGTHGAPVAQLQRVLRAWYPAERLVVDGDFGPHTERLVKLAQLQVPPEPVLAADGIVGRRTRAKLGLEP